MVQSVPQEVRVERRHSTTKLTYADYLRFPDDGLRHEIIDGEHYVTPSPATRHQRISRNLLHLIQTYLDGILLASCSPHPSTRCSPISTLSYRTALLVQ